MGVAENDVRGFDAALKNFVDVATYVSHKVIIYKGVVLRWFAGAVWMRNTGMESAGIGGAEGNVIGWRRGELK